MNPLRSSRLAAVAAFLGSASCVTAMVWGLSALAADAGPPNRTIDVSRVFAAAPLANVDLVITRTPADPTPMIERSQWVFELRWEHGDVWLLGARPLELPAPQATPRVMGRFALELFEGPALIERVRFDFPLLGAPEPTDGGWAAPPSMTSKLRTRIGVVFPATRRGTRLELLDRATNRRWSLPWPPDAPPSDGGPAVTPG